MKWRYLKLHIWDFYVEFLQNGIVTMLDIDCGGSLGCVEVKYTTHSQGIYQQSDFTVVQIYEIVLSGVTQNGTFIVAYLQNGTVKILDIEFGCSLGCVEVKYTTHSEGIMSKVILQ